MSYVSAALATAVKALGITQTSLAAQCGIGQPLLNRYFNGGNLGPDNLVRIAKVLPSPHDSALVAAYLGDLIPAGLSQHVAILPAASAAEPDPIEFKITKLLSGLKPETRKDLLYILERAIIHEEVAAILTTTARVLQGKF